MIEPTEIIRSKRMSLSITVNQRGEVIVKAPLFISESEILKFVNAKQTWIESKIKKINSTNTSYNDLLKYKNFLLFGKRYQTVLSDAKSAKFTDGVCLVPKNEDFKTSLHKVILTYKKLANKWLEERTKEIANAIGANYKSFKISDTKGRWGACNSKQQIDLNFRLVCLAPPLIDYVIVHELCHLKEMNHSPKFWDLVGKVLPDYKKRRKTVKDSSFLFEIYR